MGSHLWKWISTNIHWVYNRKSVNLSTCACSIQCNISWTWENPNWKVYMQGLLSVIPKVKQKKKVPGAFSQISQWGTALDSASSNRICLLANLLQPWTCVSTLSVINPAHNSLSLSLSLSLRVDSIPGKATSNIPCYILAIRTSLKGCLPRKAPAHYKAQGKVYMHIPQKKSTNKNWGFQSISFYEKRLVSGSHIWSV
jgi:hypothetical protein